MPESLPDRLAEVGQLLGEDVLVARTERGHQSSVARPMAQAPAKIKVAVAAISPTKLRKVVVFGEVALDICDPFV